MDNYQILKNISKQNQKYTFSAFQLILKKWCEGHLFRNNFNIIQNTLKNVNVVVSLNEKIFAIYNLQSKPINTSECEVILFCIRSTCKSETKRYVNANNNITKLQHPLYKIFKLIPQLPTNILIINGMCIESMSYDCNFINPSLDIEIFEYLYKYVFNGLLLSGISRENVKEIREICLRFDANVFLNNFIILLFNIYDSNHLCMRDEINIS